MMWWELLLLVFAGCRFVENPPLPPVRLEGTATVYHLGDGHSGDTFGCVSAARRVLGSEKFRDDLPTVAMRDGLGVPCGGAVWVENAKTGVGIWALRLDSGPYGQKPDGSFKGIIDLTPTVATAIDLPGRGVRRKGLVRLRWHGRRR